MQRSQREGSVCRSWLRLVWLLALSAACGDDSPAPLADAGTLRIDAGKTRPDAGPASQRFAAASVSLAALADDAADGGGISLTGQVHFRQTSEGVDLDIEVQGCAGESAYPLSILEASDCSTTSLQAPAWSGGQGLPVLLCSGKGVGRSGTGYSRPNDKPGPWTIGDGSASDVVGRVLVVSGASSGVPLACGVITRAEDVQRLALPAEDRAPSMAARAAVGGICLARQYPGSSPRCPDDAAVVRCEAKHCDIGNCLQTCEQYASCLDQQGIQCSFTSTCQPSQECAACQSDAQQCASKFCAEHAWCGATPTPDGPCQRLSNCCALQGPEASLCSGLLVSLLSGLGGDGNCIASMMDWDVLTHMHVPCTFGPVQLPMTAGANMETQTSAAPEPALADQHAGISCASDADCPGGTCAPGPAEAAAVSGMSAGFCTRPCDATYECGRDGLCSGGESAKQCFAACRDHSECRAGFVCSGVAQGTRISLPGACRPKRQPDQLADGIAGRACASDTECSGGQCAAQNLLGVSYPGNYCSARCYDDAHCGHGGVCLWNHASNDLDYCLQACSSDADCTREAYGCWELNDNTRALHACYPRMQSLPDQRAGSDCTSDGDCGTAHASCAKTLPTYGLATNELRDVPGGYCTQRCALDSECGAGAQCINYGTSGGMCFATCSSDKPCREGYSCFVHGRDNNQTAAVCVAPMP